MADNGLRPSEAETQQLSDQIAALKADIAELTRTVGDVGATRKDNARAHVNAQAERLRARGEETVEEARARAEDFGRQAGTAVRDQPATAVGLAVGLGFLAGYLTARK